MYEGTLPLCSTPWLKVTTVYDTNITNPHPKPNPNPILDTMVGGHYWYDTNRTNSNPNPKPIRHNQPLYGISPLRGSGLPLIRHYG